MTRPGGGDQAEGERHPRLGGQHLETLECAGPDCGVGGQHAAIDPFEDAAPLRSHDPDQRDHLLPGGQAGRHGPVVGRLVMLDPRGGEADCARLEGVRQLACHESQVVGCGLLLERPFAHGPGPQGGVPDIGGEVDALREAIDGVEIFGERLEAPVDPLGQRHRVDVLGPLEIADHQGPLVGADRGQV